jgi:hypothetical protein
LLAFAQHMLKRQNKEYQTQTSKIIFFSSNPKPSTQSGFDSVKKMGSKSHAWAPLSHDKI